MSDAYTSFSLELLVELMAAHSAQSPSGTPVERVEDRLEASLNLARRANLSNLELWLGRNDFGWLCNAQGIDRLSPSVSRLMVSAVPAFRARPGHESHILGTSGEGFRKSFPIIGDPTQTPGFRQHVPSDADKAWMLQTLKRQEREAALKSIDPTRATRH